MFVLEMTKYFLNKSKEQVTKMETVFAAQIKGSYKEAQAKVKAPRESTQRTSVVSRGHTKGDTTVPPSEQEAAWLSLGTTIPSHTQVYAAVTHVAEHKGCLNVAPASKSSPILLVVMFFGFFPLLWWQYL